MEYVNHHFHQNISLGEVSKLVNMTEMSFSRFFKRRTGVTFMDSLLECRLGNACRMLIDTTQSVSEIAYHCGFNNISNFNRLFKNEKAVRRKSSDMITIFMETVNLSDSFMAFKQIKLFYFSLLIGYFGFLVF